MTLKANIRRVFWLLNTQFGINPRKLIWAFSGLPRYLRDLRRFRSAYRGKLELYPCLHDWVQEAGSTKSEYFWQDLLVARMIHKDNPKRHVDIGSRVDGFVSHVASFREIEVLDVRPVSTHVPGIVFRQCDLMNLGDEMQVYCDSLSCLHALEHFGLGRYGDTLDVDGYKRGIENIAQLLDHGGILYLSTPVGREKVKFNANRVFDPKTIVSLAADCNLILREYLVIRPGGVVEKFKAFEDAPVESELSKATDNLGIFLFRKVAETDSYGESNG